MKLGQDEKKISRRHGVDWIGNAAWDQQMAHKIWQHKLMELVKYVIRAFAAECAELCSSKNDSMAR